MQVSLPVSVDMERSLQKEQQVIIHDGIDGKSEEVPSYFFKRMDRGSISKGTRKYDRLMIRYDIFRTIIPKTK